MIVDEDPGMRVTRSTGNPDWRVQSSMIDFRVWFEGRRPAGITEFRVSNRSSWWALEWELCGVHWR